MSGKGERGFPYHVGSERQIRGGVEMGVQVVHAQSPSISPEANAGEEVVQEPPCLARSQARSRPEKRCESPDVPSRMAQETADVGEEVSCGVVGPRVHPSTDGCGDP